MSLSSTQLTWMRAQVADRLPDTCVIQSVAQASDGYGGQTETWAAVTGGTVACRVDPYWPGNDPIDVGEREGLQVEYILTAPYDAPLAANRRVVTGGKTYEVLGLSTDKSWSVSARAYVARLD